MQIDSLVAVLPPDFADNSKVWIFQSSRAFIEKEQTEINEQLYQFYTQWMSHGDTVKGWAQLVYGQFIVVMADEIQTQIGGCSTDGMMRMIKSLERQYSVNFFDRLMITFLKNEKAEMLPFAQIQYALDNDHITEHTLTFNNAVVNTKKELLTQWLVPLKDSWLASRVSFKPSLTAQ